MHHPNSTEINTQNVNEVKFNLSSSYLKKHTLPHDDFAVSVGCMFCMFVFDNSSASPQEQSLQAFRFPVVPQTKTILRLNG